MKKYTLVVLIILGIILLSWFVPVKKTLLTINCGVAYDPSNPGSGDCKHYKYNTLKDYENIFCKRSYRI